MNEEDAFRVARFVFRSSLEACHHVARMHEGEKRDIALQCIEQILKVASAQLGEHWQWRQ